MSFSSLKIFPSTKKIFFSSLILINGKEKFISLRLVFTFSKINSLFLIVNNKFVLLILYFFKTLNFASLISPLTSKLVLIPLLK